MPQSLAQIYIHIAFSTKDRAPLLTDATIRSRLHAYIGGVCRDADSPALTVGGTEDHLHALCRLSKNLAAKDLLRETKRASSVWVKQQAPLLSDFHWQAGQANDIGLGHCLRYPYAYCSLLDLVCDTGLKSRCENEAYHIL